VLRLSGISFSAVAAQTQASAQAQEKGNILILVPLTEVWSLSTLKVKIKFFT